MAAGNLWVRRITGGPWHLVPNEAGNLAACGVRVPWRWNGRLADAERYQGLPGGFGPGTVCPACARLATGAPPRTPKLVLAAHVSEHHRGLPAGSGRWTLDQLARWHAGQHHRYGGATGSLDHYHDGSNTGPSDRPDGWRTGADVVPTRKSR